MNNSLKWGRKKRCNDMYENFNTWFYRGKISGYKDYSNSLSIGIPLYLTIDVTRIKKFSSNITIWRKNFLSKRAAKRKIFLSNFHTKRKKFFSNKSFPKNVLTPEAFLMVFATALSWRISNLCINLLWKVTEIILSFLWRKTKTHIITKIFNYFF